MLTSARDLLSRCVAVDLEVDPRTAKIFAFAAVRSEGEDKVVFRQGKLEEALSSGLNQVQQMIVAAS